MGRQFNLCFVYRHVYPNSQGHGIVVPAKQWQIREKKITSIGKTLVNFQESVQSHALLENVSGALGSHSVLVWASCCYGYTTGGISRLELDDYKYYLDNFILGIFNFRQPDKVVFLKPRFTSSSGCNVRRSIGRWGWHRFLLVVHVMHMTHARTSGQPSMRWQAWNACFMTTGRWVPRHWSPPIPTECFALITNSIKHKRFESKCVHHSSVI